MSRPVEMYPQPGKVYNPTLKDWQSFEEAPEQLVRNHRVACVLLTAENVLGLLNGTLKVDPTSPQLPADAELYVDCSNDALWKPHTGTQYEGCPMGHGKGVYLGVRASTLAPVNEGSQMPVLEVRFVETDS